MKRLRWFIPVLLAAVGLLWPVVTNGPSAQNSTYGDPVVIADLRRR